MRKNILTALFLFVTTTSFTQDSLNTRQGDIYLKRGHWRIEDRKLKAQEFKQEINKVPAAIPYYKKYNTCLYISLLSLASAGGLILIGKEKQFGSPNYGQIKPEFLITALFFEGTGFYLIIRSKKYLKQAVVIRNKNRLTIY